MTATSMSDLTALDPHIDAEALTCRAIVETPRDSRAKYDYDPESGLFELAGVLPAGMAFPLAFGFVPGTRGGDDDPLDILLLAEDPLPTGCLVTARLLGVIKAQQTEKNETSRNDRVIARVEQSRQFGDVLELNQMGAAFATEIERFFITYNDLKGKRFEILGRGGADEALRTVQNARRPQCDGL